VRLEFTGALTVFAAAVFAVLSRNTITGSLVGLSISYALQVRQREIKLRDEERGRERRVDR
jgi:hypothetical protein